MKRVLSGMLLLLAAAGFHMLSGAGPAPSAAQAAQLVRQVDHILIASGEAEKLFALLTETFQLPVAWPMKAYGGFVSGGVALGNVNLEILQDSAAGTSAEPARFTGFALEPEALRSCLPALEVRGIPHGRPEPFRSGGKTLWTTVALPEVSCSRVQVFFCEYAQDPAVQRSEMLRQLRSRNGGPLSVLSVGEIVYGAGNTVRMQEGWRKLLDPLKETSMGVWKPGAGPAIRVERAADDGIRGLVIEVGSLEQARTFLAEQGIPVRGESRILTLGGPLFDGLRVSLKERGAAEVSGHRQRGE